MDGGWGRRFTLHHAGWIHMSRHPPCIINWFNRLASKGWRCCSDFQKWISLREIGVWLQSQEFRVFDCVADVQWRSNYHCYDLSSRWQWSMVLRRLSNTPRDANRVQLQYSHPRRFQHPPWCRIWCRHKKVGHHPQKFLSEADGQRTYTSRRSHARRRPGSNGSVWTGLHSSSSAGHLGSLGRRHKVLGRETAACIVQHYYKIVETLWPLVLPEWPPIQFHLLSWWLDREVCRWVGWYLPLKALVPGRSSRSMHCYQQALQADNALV